MFQVELAAGCHHVVVVLVVLVLVSLMLMVGMAWIRGAHTASVAAKRVECMMIQWGERD